MRKVLAIGNSFSQDATHYLHQIAASDGVEMKVVNLYIGGCSLERHWSNIRGDAAEYLYELNGEPKERYVSVSQALAEEEWDYIVTQQASHDSGWPDTYEPFLGEMVGYLKERCPAARILLHKTWAYEIDSTHGNFPRYHNDQKEMFRRLSHAYETAAARAGVPLILSGDVIQRLRKEEPFRYEAGGLSLCRDGFHMSYLYGRYALAMTWYGTLTGRAVREISYVPQTVLAPEEKAEADLLKLIRGVAEDVVRGELSVGMRFPGEGF